MSHILPSKYHRMVVYGIRRVSVFWPARKEARDRARVSYGKYKCACCHGVFKSKDTEVDHIDPIVGPEGFTSWDLLISNLFCSVDNLQVLCKACHKEKTAQERRDRAQYRKKQN